MIVLDANVLIAYLDGDDSNHGAAEMLLEDAIDEDLAINPLTLAEVLIAPARDGHLESVQAALREIEVIEVPFPPGAAVHLARLRVATGLRMPDCCVLMAAEQAAATVASFDEQLGRAARSRHLGVIGLS